MHSIVMDFKSYFCFFVKNLVEKSSQRLIQLGKMWEEKRVPLIKEIRDLNEKLSTSDVSRY